MVRLHDLAAFAELYRRHRPDAQRYAKQLTRRYLARDVAEDVVAEATRKVLTAFLHGHGPQNGFRPYLFTAIRSVTFTLARRPELVLDGKAHDHDVPTTPDDRDDTDIAMAAFSSLPDQWRRVLWVTAALDLTPTQAAGLLGMTRAAVAMMAMRARAALRIAYIGQHLPSPTEPPCRRATELLGRRFVSTITVAQTAFLENHTSQCSPCADAAKRITQDIAEWTRSSGWPTTAIAAGITPNLPVRKRRVDDAS